VELLVADQTFRFGNVFKRSLTERVETPFIVSTAKLDQAGHLIARADALLLQGEVAIQQLRTLPPGPRPIIAVVGVGWEQNFYTDAVDLGVDLFIETPCTPDFIVAMIERARVRRDELTKEVQLSDPGDISFAGWTMHGYSTHVIKEATSESIALTPTEARVFRILLQAKGKIVASEQLATIWRSTADALSSLRLYIYYLRKKLGHDAIVSALSLGYHGYALNASAT
jgi:DNA-binding response OmpR family regulator